MKTFLSRTLPFVLCIVLGMAVSWVSIYVFWFAVWTFHSLPAARACDAAGRFILLPARYFFEWMGGDQSTEFADPISYAGTNGLFLGLLLYSVFREILKAIWRRRINGRDMRSINGRSPEAKAAERPL